jgi:hypothetical protein
MMIRYTCSRKWPVDINGKLKILTQKSELDWEILPHLPYSLDLAPSNYHLFRPLSNNLLGVPFNNNAELQNWLNFFRAKPAEFFRHEIENLPERWEAVVNNGGEYITD